MMKKIILLSVLILNSFFNDSICICAQERIQMRNDDGTYTIPCVVNDLKLRFIFDTGAANVSISATEALFMLKNDYISKEDFIDKESFMLADGSLVEDAIINLREVQIGSRTLSNIKASVSYNISAPILLGLNVINLLQPWYIEDDCLVFGRESEENDIDSLLASIPIDKCLAEASNYERKGDIRSADILYKRACASSNNNSILAYLEFSDRNKYENDVSWTICKQYAEESALSGFEPTIKFLKQHTNYFGWYNNTKDDEIIAINHYRTLIDAGHYYLCMAAHDFAIQLDMDCGEKFSIIGAEHGNPECQCEMGRYYDPSFKVGDAKYHKKDSNESGKWYKLAADSGNVSGMYDYACYLFYDKGDDTSKKTALSYFNKAANLGDTGSQHELVKIYYNSDNGDKSLFWAQKLVFDEMYSKSANAYIGMIYCENDKPQEGFDYLFNSAKRSSSIYIVPPTLSYLYLGDCYYYGFGTPINYQKAADSYVAFLDWSDEDNCDKDDAIYIYCRLCHMYDNGLGVSKNKIHAFNYAKKAAELGDMGCARYVATKYFLGEIVKEDIDLAVFWFKKAAGQGDAYSCYSLGYIYSKSSLGHFDINKAIEYHKKAAENNYAESLFQLGVIYENGVGGTQKSYKTAAGYYKKAAELGDQKAKEKLKEFE